MKKTMLLLIVFATLTNVSAQIKVNSSGNVGIGKDPMYKLDVAGDIYFGSTTNVLGTTNDVPITFKVNNVIAGYTGISSNYNASFGYRALPNSSSGSNNTAIGYNALLGNTSGSGNTANGSFSLNANTSGSQNTANGNYALAGNMKGSNNTANGSFALGSNTEGSCNTAVGFQALTNNTTGSNNTAIGFYSGVNNPNSLTNSTAIGFAAACTASNQVIIGNTSIGQIGGYANWSNFSDGRGKKNIQTNVPGLNFINLLQPVTYNLDLDAVDNLLGIDKAKNDQMDKDMPKELKDKNEKARKDKQDEVQTGFVAQDVEKAAKKAGYNFNGVNIDEKGIYSLSYAEFVVPLVKAVQELSEKNDQLQEQVNELTGLVDKLIGKDADASAFRSDNSNFSITNLSNLAGGVSASLEQNVPNPFNQTTVIHYTLPETCTSAKVLITNSGGKAVKQIPLSATGGKESITIHGGSIPVGVYLYTLICDGKPVDTKRMVLTK